MDILNEVVTGRTRQTRHLKSHHLQGGRIEVDLPKCTIKNGQASLLAVSQVLRS
jgi:hypothetical protein